MSGEENRKIFFNDRGFDLSEGYQILRGGVDLKGVNNDGSGVIGRANFIKVLLLLLRKERVNEGSSIFCIFSLPRLMLASASVLPLLLEDVNRRMKDWGTEGKINPFNEVYDASLHLFMFL